MTLTKEQIASFREAALPLMRWLNENCHPHCTAIVDSERAEIVEGLATAMRREPAQKRCENCGETATHIGSHWNTGGMLVCALCAATQQFSHTESLEDRAKRVRETLSGIREQEGPRPYGQ